jgi:hypothetical protein
MKKLNNFFNGKYIINENMVSAQDEQRPIKERLEDKGVIYNGTPM